MFLANVVCMYCRMKSFVTNLRPDLVMISLALGAILMLGILVRYIQSRRQLVTWSVKYGVLSSNGSTIPNHLGHSPQISNSIYDRWLMTRFTIAFIVLR